jgi:hypothetical protein
LSVLSVLLVVSVLPDFDLDEVFSSPEADFSVDVLLLSFGSVETDEAGSVEVFVDSLVDFLSPVDFLSTGLAADLEELLLFSDAVALGLALTEEETDAVGFAAAVPIGVGEGFTLAAGEALALGATDAVAVAIGVMEADGPAAGLADVLVPDWIVLLRELLTPTLIPTEGCTP